MTNQGPCRGGSRALRSALSAAIAAACAGVPLHVAAQASAPATVQAQRFDIPAGPLVDALSAYGTQSGVQLVYQPALVGGKTTRGVSGRFTAGEALRQLLVGSGLASEAVNGSTVVLREATATAPAPPSRTSAPRPPQADATAPRIGELENVVVTGTRISGVEHIASPISIHTREEIDQSGAGSLVRFVQTLPQNFQGGAWEGTGALGMSGGGSSVNAVAGTGVNLRGLGNDSTLALVNGRRMAAGNNLGNFVDISLIPLAAVERVEVVADGASALYGSDAVGGVVNFIMRKDFDGMETRVRHGAVTEGGLREYQVAQTVGKVWNSGRGVLSYEYFDQAPLLVDDKSWVRDKAGGPMELMPEQKRHGLFLSVDQSIGEHVELFGDATYTRRRTPNSHQWIAGLLESNFRADIRAHSATVGLRRWIGDSHELEVSVSDADSGTDRDTQNLLLDGRVTSRQQVDTGVRAYDASLTGSLFDLPAGPVGYAAGLHHRTESFRDFNVLTDVLTFENDRDILAGFVEARVPLLGTGQGQPALEVTVAARYEDYSDFGSTLDPKVGLIWRPSDGLRVRGTWGTSFKAPLLTDLNPVVSQFALTMVDDPTVGTRVPVGLVFGGNAMLRPEKADSWTVGMDWTPLRMPGLRGEITYYNIAYRDRVALPQLAFAGVVGSFNSNLLVREDVLARFITRDPTVAELEALIASAARFTDATGIPGGTPLDSVAAIGDARALNLSSVRTDGIDISLSHRKDLGAMTVRSGVSGTYILSLDNTLAPNVPVIRAADTIFNPASLKMRAHASLQRGGLNAAMFLNYTGAYRDTRNNGSIPVASMTTLDMNVTHAFSHAEGFLSGAAISLGANNLTDQAPPYIAAIDSRTPSLVFDGANADTRGRFLYVQFSKRY